MIDKNLVFRNMEEFEKYYFPEDYKRKQEEKNYFIRNIFGHEVRVKKYDRKNVEHMLNNIRKALRNS